MLQRSPRSAHPWHARAGPRGINADARGVVVARLCERASLRVVVLSRSRFCDVARLILEPYSGRSLRLLIFHAKTMTSRHQARFVRVPRGILYEDMLVSESHDTGLGDRDSREHKKIHLLPVPRVPALDNVNTIPSSWHAHVKCQKPFPAASWCANIGSISLTCAGHPQR